MFFLPTFIKRAGALVTYEITKYNGLTGKKCAVFEP